jgi:hypothetical protein
MSSFVNPLDRQGSSDAPERAAAIKLWIRQTLSLAEETVVSVSQFGCGRPGCLNQKTTILVMSENAPTRQISIHKSIEDVGEVDVLDACSDPRNAPS